MGRGTRTEDGARGTVRHQTECERYAWRWHHLAPAKVLRVDYGTTDEVTLKWMNMLVDYPKHYHCHYVTIGAMRSIEDGEFLGPGLRKIARTARRSWQAKIDSPRQSNTTSRTMVSLGNEQLAHLSVVIDVGGGDNLQSATTRYHQLVSSLFSTPSN